MSRFNNAEESAEIYENEPPGTVVKRLQARSTSSLLFELVEGDKYNLFMVNPSTGVLITKRPLDYESCHVYNLTVTATNMVRTLGKLFYKTVAYGFRFLKLLMIFLTRFIPVGRFESRVSRFGARSRQKRQFAYACKRQLQRCHKRSCADRFVGTVERHVANVDQSRRRRFRIQRSTAIRDRGVCPKPNVSCCFQHRCVLSFHNFLTNEICMAVVPEYCHVFFRRD